MITTPHRIVTVVVVDDSSLVRGRICALLMAEPSVRIVGEASSVCEALWQFEQHRPEAMVLDLQLPDGSGFEVLRSVKTAAPACLVILLTQFREPAFQDTGRALGADHVLYKAGEFDRVPEILRALALSPARTRS